MRQEEKQLLLKDLCARLPYGVIVDYKENEFELPHWKITTIYPETLDGWIGYDKRVGAGSESGSRPFKIGEVKPYLRPMSSMTEEEWKEYNQIGKSFAFTDEVDWLNEHHFDYRGLIPMGLALEAPEGMYNKEEPEKGSEVPVPKTVDEAISTLEKILSDEDREYLLENGAISMHDSLGRWIRNEWGLWTGSELKNELMSMNKGLNHPDDMSNYIIEEFIKYWNNKL